MGPAIIQGCIDDAVPFRAQRRLTELNDKFVFVEDLARIVDRSSLSMLDSVKFNSVVKNIPYHEVRLVSEEWRMERKRTRSSVGRLAHAELSQSPSLLSG